MNDKPLAIDLCCGLGGWSEGLLAAGWDVIGFDIEQHVYGDDRYPAQLVVQDILTLHGSQFATADLIVASPPCQFFSYTAMPWSRAKALAVDVRADPARLAKELSLFNACFRIQREAAEAAGRRIPMVVENVKGAQPWVGRARWSFGSYFLWGDVPALMPVAKSRKNSGGSWFNIGSPGQVLTNQNPVHDSRKVPGFRFDGSGRSFQTASVEGIKNRDADGYERDHPNVFGWKIPRSSSGGGVRKAASAKIAKIPFALSEWIGRAWFPLERAA
jgi:hypothetical protein